MKRYIQYILIITVSLGLLGCASRKKNTAQTRMYHSFFARYNTFYNGDKAFRESKDQQLAAHKDNYLERLPLLVISNENTQKTGASGYDKAIEKSQKAIKNHSITRKPRREAGSKLSEKKKAFYAQKEFNPFLWRAWLLMADAYFQKGEFTEAASTYIYITRLYDGNPDVLAKARIGLAQCYTELEWYYEAEDMLSRIQRDSIPSKEERNLAHAHANLLLGQGRFGEAIPYIEKAIKRRGITKHEKTREYYLLGQLHQMQGNNKEAFKYFGKVISMSPPYEMELNARIRQTENVTDESKKKIIRQLERMVKSSKNEQYQAELYYAIGNVYLSDKDTIQALRAYQSGEALGEGSGYSAAMIQLQMAEIYWKQHRFSKSGECYQKAMSTLDKERDDYKRNNLRKEVASQLKPHTDIIESAGERLYWATLPPTKLNPLIDKKIEQAEFEKELQKKVEKKNRSENAPGGDLAAAGNAANMGIDDPASANAWYFYNKKIVSQGINSFKKNWNDRQLKDYWRLSQESYVPHTENDTIAGSELPADSTTLATDSIAGGEIPLSDEELPTLNNDPCTREYYLQQIPKDEETIALLHDSLSNAIYNAAIIFEEELGDKDLALHYWQRLIREYPQFDKRESAYYHLFIAASRWGENDLAEASKSVLTSEYPDSASTKRILDPDFFESVATKQHKEDSLYVATYALYKQQQYSAVIEKNRYAKEKYPQGKHRARFMFIDALSKLYNGDERAAMNALGELVATYPTDSIKNIAAEINSGINQGRLLNSGISLSIWERKSDGTIRNTEDSIASFSTERNEPYYFVLAYPNDSLDEKRLLFELARHNFSNYMVRNFEMEFNRLSEITLLQVKEFLNFDEAYIYQKRLYSDAEMAKTMEGINAMIISKSNLDLLLQYYSFGEYMQFYMEHFMNIPEVEIDGYTLDEPGAYEMLRGNPKEEEEKENKD